MKTLKITILVENTVGVPIGLLSEWGLSMLLDFGDERILFDTGEQGNLINNAQILGHDLRQIDRVILSNRLLQPAMLILFLLKDLKSCCK